MRIPNQLSLVLCFTFFISSLSFAAEQGETNKADLKAARDLFKKGTAQFNSGLFDEASKSFRDAYQLQPNWKIQYNIAQSEAAAKHHGLALTAFETYLALGGDDINDPQRLEEVQREIERLKKMVGYVSVKAPEGAIILINGIEQGTAPLAGVIPISGSVVHEVTVKLPNGKILPVQKVSLVSGKQADLSFIENTAETVTPPVSDTDKTAKSEPATQSESVPVSKAKKDKIKPLKLVGWITLGVGAATVIAGGVVGGLALSADKAIEKNCTNEGCYNDDMGLVYKRDNLSLTSDVLFAVGGTATAAGLVIVLIGAIKAKKEHNTEKTVFISPIFNRQNAGLSLEVRF